MSRSIRSRALLGVAAIAFAPAFVAPTFAQEEEEASDDRIVVTGSRIARDTFTSESPVTVVSGEAIALSGELGLGDALRQQLAVGAGGFNSSSVLSGGGAESIDLRNLGADRVLNLINGRRVANFADALQNEASDLSFIPQAMIDRIEILRDGASAVYGADAVTGVVNVILKNDFEGLSLSGQVGQSSFSDRESVQLQAVMGGNFDRGNVVLAAEYNYRASVPQRDRPWAIPTISFLREGTDANPSTVFANGSTAHPGGTFRFDNDSDGAFGDPGTQIWCTVPRNIGGDEITNVGATAQCPTFSPSGIDQLPSTRYDYALGQNILNGSEVINLATFGNYEIAEGINFFLEGQYSDRQSESNLDGNPLFAGSPPGPFSDIIVPGSNPYNPFPGIDAQLFRLRPTTTVGPRNQTIDATSFRMATGIQGDQLFGDWNWELSYLYTEVSAHVVTDATFNFPRLQRIADPVACAADVLCTAALSPNSLGALDIYRPGNWAESEIAYFRQVSAARTRFELEGISGYLGGDLFELPAGPVGVAAGFEYREERVVNRPDSVTEAGESVANQTFTTKGGYDTRELYGEVNLPIFKDQAIFQSLNVNGQVRYFDYSTFGSDFVWKVGLDWALSEDIRFRGTYGTSFRAPTLVDTFSGGTVSFDFIDDPCDAGVLGGVEGTATRLANCASAGPLGVQPGFTQVAAQLQVLAGGDLADGTFDLEPEEARTFTVGTVITPTFFDGFRLSADYWNIEVTNFIDTLDLEEEVLDQCYDSANLSDPTCAFITRDAGGNLRNLVRTPLNRPDALKTSGVDWAVDYTTDFGPGVLTLDHQGTYTLNYDTGGGDITGLYFSSNGAGIRPRYRLVGSVRYDISDFFGQLRVRHTPSIDDTRFNGNNVLGYDQIDAMTELDLRVGWNAGDTTSVVFGVNNLTNEEPPYAFNTGNNTAPGAYGSAVIGRYYFLRATKNF